MISPALQEQKSFIYFLLLLCLTITSIVVSNIPDFFSGIFLVLWGMLGVSRYTHLSGDGYRKLPNILTLPSRILFGFNQKMEGEANKTIDKFLKSEVIFFIILGFLFILWGVYCSFFPVDASFLQSFWAEKEGLITKPDMSLYIIMERFSYYIMLALIFFISMTYAEIFVFSKNMKRVLTSLLVFLVGYIIIFLPVSFVIISSDFSSLKGIGWGGFYIMEALVPQNIQNTDSLFVRRYIETGIIGAYGLYFVFLLVFFSLLKQLFIQADRFYVSLALLMFLVLFGFDIFWLWTPLITAFQLLSLAFIGFIWRPSLTKEQI